MLFEIYVILAPNYSENLVQAFLCFISYQTFMSWFSSRSFKIFYFAIGSAFWGHFFCYSQTCNVKFFANSYWTIFVIQTASSNVYLIALVLKNDKKFHIWNKCFLTFPACFKIPIIFSNLNSNCSNLLHLRNLS